jgi:hypothetical protein
MNVASVIERKDSAATIKLRNERGIARISAHPKAEKPEEQHHNAQHAHTQFFCLHALADLELWGLKT